MAREELQQRALGILESLVKEIPDQLGALIASSYDGKLFASSGDLHQREDTAKDIWEMLPEARRVIGVADPGSPLKKVSAVYPSHILEITMDDTFVYAVKRPLPKH
ncbi:hypothetical protein BJ742DRAFT_783400 [Cladochytrium replicatum]|nr:hypothetical protein BJ742DRAFT_783400 [Cladochytrium replicatum]